MWLLIAGGFALRVWGVWFGLPHDFARPDEEKLIGAALGIFQGDPNPHFFLYPTLFIYVIAAAFAALFAIQRVAGATASQAAFVAQSLANPSILHLAPRMLAALLGTATIPVLYSAARRLSSTRAALISSTLLAVVFLHVRDSHFGTTDVPATFLTVCALAAAASCEANGVTPRRVAAAGLLSGLAASTKYNSALAVLPAMVVIGRGFRSRDAAWRTASLIGLLFTGLGIGFLAGTPFALLDWSGFLAEFTIQSRTAFGTHHGATLDAARAVVGERGWSHHLTFTLRYGLGIPLLGAALAGAGWLIVEQPQTAAVVLSFPVVFYAAMGVSLLVYARWMVPIVPFLCLTAGMLVDRAARAIEHMAGRARAAAVAIGVSLACIAGPTLARAIAFDRLVARTDTRVLGAQWIESHCPGGAALYQTGAVYGYLQPRPSERYTVVAFDERRHRFRGAAIGGGLPDVVVVLESPLAVYSAVPDELNAILDQHYTWVETFKGTISARMTGAVYDQQDAFFVPFAGFDAVKRPGPDVHIFERRRP